MQTALLGNAVGNRKSPERFIMFVSNDEASNALPAGEPCCFKMDGTNDGHAVEKATTGAAVKATTLFAGVVISEIAAGKVGEVVVYGLLDNVIFIRWTRADSSLSHTSAPAVALGDILQVDTVGNGLKRAAAGAASGFLPYAVAAETFAAVVSLASTTSDTTTRNTSSGKVFLRAM